MLTERLCALVAVGIVSAGLLITFFGTSACGGGPSPGDAAAQLFALNALSANFGKPKGS